jgi:hypothetical protein
MPREIPWLTRRGGMTKLRMPEDRKAILKLVFDRMRGLEAENHRLAIPTQGDPRLVSHQLGLQSEIEDPSVRMGVDELIGEGKVVMFEPARVNTQPKDSPIDLRVLYARTVA